MKKKIKTFEPDKFDVKDFVPWHDSSEWDVGKFYPVPHSDSANFDGTTVYLLGGAWGVYRLDPRFKKGDPLFGDIVPVLFGVPMKDAFMAAQCLNESATK